MLRRLALPSFLFLASIATAPAQESQAVPAPSAAAAPAQGSGSLVLPAGQTQLPVLLDRTARALGQNILFDVAQFDGVAPLVLQSELQLGAERFEQVVLELLYQRGFVMHWTDRALGIRIVRRLDDPRCREIFTTPVPRTAAEVLQNPDRKEVVVVRVDLQHVNANIATNSLRPFFAQGGAAPGMASPLTFGTAGSNQSLVLAGMQHLVAGALRLLQSVDTEDAGAGEPSAASGVVMDPVTEVARLAAEVRSLRARIDALK